MRLWKCPIAIQSLVLLYSQQGPILWATPNAKPGRADETARKKATEIQLEILGQSDRCYKLL